MAQRLQSYHYYLLNEDQHGVEEFEEFAKRDFSAD